MQKESIRKEPRRSGPVWVYRYYADKADGRRVERNYVLGTLKELPSESRAWQKVRDLDLLTQINNDVRRSLAECTENSAITPNAGLIRGRIFRLTLSD